MKALVIADHPFATAWRRSLAWPRNPFETVTNAATFDLVSLGPTASNVPEETRSRQVRRYEEAKCVLRNQRRVRP